MRPPAGWTVTAADKPTVLIVEVINAQRIFRWLTRPQRAALLAHQDGHVTAHPRVLQSLHQHGITDAGGRLTEAGQSIARWNTPKEVQP